MNILEGRMYAPLLPTRPSRSWIALPVSAALLALLSVAPTTIDATFAKAPAAAAVAAAAPASPAPDDDPWAADESRYGSRPDYAH